MKDNTHGQPTNVFKDDPKIEEENRNSKKVQDQLRDQMPNNASVITKVRNKNEDDAPSS